MIPTGISSKPTSYLTTLRATASHHASSHDGARLGAPFHSCELHPGDSDPTHGGAAPYISPYCSAPPTTWLTISSPRTRPMWTPCARSVFDEMPDRKVVQGKVLEIDELRFDKLLWLFTEIDEAGARDIPVPDGGQHVCCMWCRTTAASIRETISASTLTYSSSTRRVSWKHLAHSRVLGSWHFLV